MSEMVWSLHLRMDPNDYDGVQRALAELCVRLADDGVLDGWTVMCPSLVRERQHGIVASSRSKDALLAAEGSG